VDPERGSGRLTNLEFWLLLFGRMNVLLGIESDSSGFLTASSGVDDSAGGFDRVFIVNVIYVELVFCCLWLFPNTIQEDSCSRKL
jgi:hypothetical protein